MMKQSKIPFMGKKIISLAIFLAFINLNAYEINFNKAFTTKVSPDILSTNIYISVDKKDDQKIVKILAKFDNFFKNTKSVKLKNGSYSISPNYEYDKDETKFIGYVGNVGYQVESDKATKINTFITDLFSLKKKLNSDDIKIQVSNIQWSISNNLYNKNAEDLRIKAILWANDYVQNLSKKLKTTCSIKKIDVNSQARHPQFYGNVLRKRTKSFSFSSAIAPIKSDEIININSNFTLECK